MFQMRRFLCGGQRVAHVVQTIDFDLTIQVFREELHGLAHAAGWEPYNLHDLAHVAWDACFDRGGAFFVQNGF